LTSYRKDIKSPRDTKARVRLNTKKVMKKSLFGVSILNKKFVDGKSSTLKIILRRQIHESQTFEMHQQQHQGQHSYKNRSNMQQHHQNSREDVLRNFRKWIKVPGVVEKQGQIFTLLNYNILR
jgi:hypothetical protein